jgi:diguanylate cyclase (GGDEF)-like protein
LTNLPNRVLIGETIENAIAAHAPFALLFMDVDHFKDVNDALGHSSGDRLLREVAERLAAQTSPDDAVGRYGGDEFVMIIAAPTQRERLKRVLDGIKAAFAAPVQIDDVQIHVRTSIGITLYPADGDDAETLLKNADAAMYAAKAAGRDGVRRFEPALRRAAEWRMALSRSLRTAAQDGELTLVYQPQVDIRTGRVSGLEALLRWNDPEHGAVSPAEFIPVAEETGLIAEIGEWVLHKACADAKQWAPDLRISVNVSPQQITRGDFRAVVERVLDATRLAPSRLELEITESVLVAPGAFPSLRALSELGVGIAIDDFGSGYSSLSYLRDFHADRLKIDMSFVRGIGANSADEAVIKAILALARTLGFAVVAEGVETLAQLEFLLEGQCDVVQGYYFARPMPATEVAGFIKNFEPAYISNA